MRLRDDKEIHTAVMEALYDDPRVEAGAIGIAVELGAVTLTGAARSFAEKWAIEEIVKRISGVRALANEIEVELAGTHHVSDTDLALAAANVLQWDAFLPETLQVEVERGVVTLSGSVDWEFQRVDAQNVVSRLHGVRNVINRIDVRGAARTLQI
ncbi:MAG: BON domain-containing protein [Candidatus Eremiobacteraeota bacterium]|nr:BON domain-containing protein [Candidatus Eremiobacteraeota bacterium]